MRKVSKINFNILALSFVSTMVCLSQGNAFAASTDWQELGGGKVRLVANLDPSNNQLSGALEIQLEDGWKTYWRSPGDSGIPPQFDFSASKNVTFEPVEFPVPEVIQIPSSRFAGYHGNVSFPFSATVDGQDAEVNLALLIGVCSDICIPATANFSIPSQDLNTSDFKAEMALELANSHLPKQSNSELGALKETTLTGNNLHFSVTLPEQMNGDTSAPALLVEGPQDWYLAMPELNSVSEATASFSMKLPSNLTATDIRATELHYTLITAKGVGVEGKVIITD